MQIGELAGSLGVSTKTLRFYESIGLLPHASRSGNGYRLYSPVAVARARQIVALRRLEVPIEAIASLIDQTDEASLRRKIISLVDQRLRDYRLQIAVLQGKEEDLRSRLDALLREPAAVAEIDEIGRLFGCLGESGTPAKGRRRARLRASEEGLTLP